MIGVGVPGGFIVGIVMDRSKAFFFVFIFNCLVSYSHIEKGYALHGTNQESLALVEINKYRALFNTVMASGAGSSYENPIMVVTPKDAEVIVLGHKLTVLSKTMNGQTGRYYDVYLVRNEQGKQYPIYFDITLPYTIGMKKLSEK